MSRQSWTHAAQCPQCRRGTFPSNDGNNVEPRKRICLSCNLTFKLVHENARGWYRTGVTEWATE